ncbi:deoxyribonuclease IV [Nitrospiraceae bacterium HYJII51-Mn-bac16s-1-B09]|uniref:Probable endonuclease 4 n=1 Tax=Candidatus Manganitrophus noduliformans TaxID=2606439 RepID=A0A7X6IC86_9BACT|nr:deoxyribonuclease IV [Candidatus Manganitrophus noduliformans]
MEEKLAKTDGKVEAKRPLLGAHMSVAGGLDQALYRGRTAGCDVIQIFSKNSNQWKAKPLTVEDIANFKKARLETGVFPAMVHSSYLINLCSDKEEEWKKSVEALHIEMERVEALEMPYLVLHPGSHLGAGEEVGISRAAEALNLLFQRTARFKMQILIELTAGQGSCIGSRFEEVGAIFDRIKAPERIGVCFDTCHVFAAGYDLRTETDYQETMAALDRAVGLGQVRAFHLNDCKKELGCRVDRHDHIGRGKMGTAPFSFLMNDPRFFGLPMVLETPKGKELKEDIQNLAILRNLQRR